MNKCIIIPDSFKGTMSSIEVCGIMKEKLSESFPDCEIVAVPAADGGEGTVDCFLHASAGEKIRLTVKGPHLEDIQSYYGIIGDTAVIEMAAAAGLHLAGEPMDPASATTFGVGQLVSDAIGRGCTKIILGLGGSCTNDGGAGAAAALGARFFDSDENEFLPTGGTLARIAGIDLAELRPRLEGITFTVMCDIDNPLYGPRGAACVFAPQKGAGVETVVLLDENLRTYADVVRRSVGVDVSELEGGGAAGGMGAGVFAFFGAELKSGIEVVLDFIHFEELLERCDYVLTGEGRLDLQSLGGKVVIGVGRRAQKMNVPVLAVVGSTEEGLEDINGQGISGVFPAVREEFSLADLKLRCRADLSNVMNQVVAAIKQDEAARQNVAARQNEAAKRLEENGI